MISGTDVIIPTTRGTEALSLAIRAVNTLWPDALLADPITGESFRHYEKIDFACRNEILAFRDCESATLWDKLGADPSLDGTLIHLLLSDGKLTIAIDSHPPAEISVFVEKMRQSLG